MTIPLDFQIGESEHGEYLAASFDFGAIFSKIETVTLSFSLDQAFEGDIVTTGNSTFSRWLGLSLSDDAAPSATLVEFNQPLGQLLWRVPANAAHRFSAPGSGITFPGGEPIPGEWPDFLYDGAGRVAIADISWSQTHPLPDNIVTSETIAWNAPAGLSSATLTISGRAVPEPSGLVLAGGIVGLWSAAAFACRRQLV